MGESLPNLDVFSASNDWGMSGVYTGPGATALTRMPRSMSSRARPLVKLTMALLVTA